MSLEATRTLVRGRQPRSGLICILCKLMSLCSRGKRLTQTYSVLMFFCPYVLRVSDCQGTLWRQLLCLLRPPRRQSVAVRRAAALCVSYVNLCSYVHAVSGFPNLVNASPYKITQLIDFAPYKLPAITVSS